ncbi:MAG: hypothetical protein LBR20_00160 [Propionibacteriaceae bacterium]|jgi:hypothetical protein|nr:hypothetical protein [Propionibacteriaceae bacterium]
MFEAILAVGLFGLLIGGFELLGWQRQRVVRAYRESLESSDFRWGRQVTPPAPASSPVFPG